MVMAESWAWRCGSRSIYVCRCSYSFVVQAWHLWRRVLSSHFVAIVILKLCLLAVGSFLFFCDRGVRVVVMEFCLLGSGVVSMFNCYGGWWDTQELLFSELEVPLNIVEFALSDAFDIHQLITSAFGSLLVLVRTSHDLLIIFSIAYACVRLVAFDVGSGEAILFGEVLGAGRHVERHLVGVFGESLRRNSKSECVIVES